MVFELKFSEEAQTQLDALEKDRSKKKREKAVKKALGFLSINTQHPSLQTHEFDAMSRELGFKVFEAYAENRTPGAYRIFWRYGPEKKQITILAITQHP